MRRRLLAMTLPVLLAGCIEADLGEVPLLCNPGVPHCPSGYTCVRHKERSYCLRNGASADRCLAPLVDGGSSPTDGPSLGAHLDP